MSIKEPSFIPESGVGRPAKDAANDPTLSSTLMRGLEILALFNDKTDRLSNGDIAKLLGQNKATVSRLCKTLIHMGYLRRDDKGLFHLAPLLLHLSYPLLAKTRWRHQLTPTMLDLAEISSGNVTLAVMSGHQFVQVHSSGNPVSFPHAPEPGNIGPLHRAASGWALLSLLQDKELEETFGQLRQYCGDDFEAFQDKTLAAIARCHSDGFCTSYGDWRPNIFGVAAPLGETSDELKVSLVCGIPSYRARKDDIEQDLGPRMVAAAESIRTMGLFSL